MKEITKYQAFKITHLAGVTGAVIKETKTDVDESYDEITGIEVYENSSGGVTNGYYQVGISDGDRDYAAIVHKNSLLTNASVPQPLKSKPITIPIRKGMGLKARTYWPAAGALASDLEYEIVYRLVKRVVEN